MEVIKCTELANSIKAKAKELVETNELKVAVAIVQVGGNKSSNTYITRKCESMKSCGIKPIVVKTSNKLTTHALKERIKELNDMDEITGIIVQLPLPKHIDVFEVLETINPKKDVDCLTSRNLGFLAKGKPYIKPATPYGVMHLLDNKLNCLDGFNVLMIGRSEIVGLPLSLMLTQRNCTVTLAHSWSDYNVNDYEIVISAIGKPNHIIVSNPNTMCIDVGINYVDGVQVGDFDINNKDFNCEWVSAPKGGTGVLTSATVCLNAIELVMKKEGIM